MNHWKKIIICNLWEWYGIFHSIPFRIKMVLVFKYNLVVEFVLKRSWSWKNNIFSGNHFISFQQQQQHRLVVPLQLIWLFCYSSIKQTTRLDRNEYVWTNKKPTALSRNDFQIKSVESAIGVSKRKSEATKQILMKNRACCNKNENSWIMNWRWTASQFCTISLIQIFNSIW